MSIVHQHSHPPAKYCSSVIPPSGFELNCLRWRIGASTIRYGINLSTKQLLKRHKLTHPSNAPLAFRSLDQAFIHLHSLLLLLITVYCEGKAKFNFLGIIWE